MESPLYFFDEKGKGEGGGGGSPAIIPCVSHVLTCVKRFHSDLLTFFIVSFSVYLLPVIHLFLFWL